MKKILIIICIPLLVSCTPKSSVDAVKNEIFQTEKEFEKMVSDKGLAEAFYYFADENAVIKRGNDSLITGKENIRSFFNKNPNQNSKLSWTPDFIEVSECGTLGYTYGKYIFTIQDSTGKNIENRGIFHTVWKKRNNEWKFVWD
jgi:ketosteroid isomerase-like protein